MLKINTTLKKLNLYKNNIKSDGEKALLEALEINKTIKINLHSKNSYFTAKSRFFGSLLQTAIIFI